MCATCPFSWHLRSGARWLKLLLLCLCPVLLSRSAICQSIGRMGRAAAPRYASAFLFSRHFTRRRRRAATELPPATLRSRQGLPRRAAAISDAPVISSAPPTFQRRLRRLRYLRSRCRLLSPARSSPLAHSHALVRALKCASTKYLTAAPRVSPAQQIMPLSNLRGDNGRNNRESTVCCRLIIFNAIKRVVPAGEIATSTVRHMAPPPVSCRRRFGHRLRRRLRRHLRLRLHSHRLRSSRAPSPLSSPASTLDPRSCRYGCSLSVAFPGGGFGHRYDEHRWQSGIERWLRGLGAYAFRLTSDLSLPACSALGIPIIPPSPPLRRIRQE